MLPDHVLVEITLWFSLSQTRATSKQTELCLRVERKVAGMRHSRGLPPNSLCTWYGLDLAPKSQHHWGSASQP